MVLMNPPAIPSADTPLSAAWARQLIDYVRSIALRKGLGYDVQESPSGTTLRLHEPAVRQVGGFSGNVWVGALRKTGYRTDPTKPWVKVILSTGAVSEELGPPSNPVADGEVWFEKSNTWGDARLDRVG
jgi:hypothetical protein